jgi:hypothetical protein
VLLPDEIFQPLRPQAISQRLGLLPHFARGFFK